MGQWKTPSEGLPRAHSPTCDIRKLCQFVRKLCQFVREFIDEFFQFIVPSNEFDHRGVDTTRSRGRADLRCTAGLSRRPSASISSLHPHSQVGTLRVTMPSISSTEIGGDAHRSRNHPTLRETSPITGIGLYDLPARAIGGSLSTTWPAPNGSM